MSFVNVKKWQKLRNLRLFVGLSDNATPILSLHMNFIIRNLIVGRFIYRHIIQVVLNIYLTYTYRLYKLQIKNI